MIISGSSVHASLRNRASDNMRMIQRAAKYNKVPGMQCNSSTYALYGRSCDITHKYEPPVGIEPTTVRLRSACSTN